MSSSFADDLTIANLAQSRLRQENAVLKRRVEELERENEVLRKSAKFGGDRVPAGYEPIEAYTNGEVIVVLGEPAHDDESHDCDFLGCATFSHVVARIDAPKMYRYAQEAK